MHFLAAVISAKSVVFQALRFQKRWVSAVLCPTGKAQVSGLRRGVWGCSNPHRNSEGPPKSWQTQPDLWKLKNCWI